MKKTIFGILKVLVPIALGVWLVFYFYNQLDEEQRGELFTAFGQANWWWLLACVILGWLSHMSRAWRWRYLLGHMGYETRFWNSYHAVMTGYFMNMLLPRAGEASRAVTLYRTEGVPFERGFGTILAERAVDMVMLLSIAGVTLALQWDRLGMFQERIAAFRADQGEPVQGAGSTGWGTWFSVVLVLALIGGAYMVWSRPVLRARAKDAIRGFIAGVRSVFQTKDKGPFILHTFIIWTLYVAMFAVGFYALPTTAEVPAAGIMAGFLAGSVGIILVQGGIGVFPAFVALIVGMYMAPPEGGGLIRPDALAMGWLLWVAQTLMIITLGGVSLLLVSRSRKHVDQ
ncbi:MAG: flippase-like domain-containing protein [Flavobacteriales bacterium]|nr:flippase-like domain-containing protein [Flavobacteriales bacterium]